MRQIALLLAAAAFVPSCGGGQEAPGKGKAPAAKVNAPPELQAAAWLGSGALTLAGLKGSVVVLDFWNTTSGRCRKLMPALAELYTKHRVEGLVVIGITEDDKADVEAFLKDHPVPYPLAMDRRKGSAGQTFDAYDISDIPTSVLIGRNGAVAWKGPGGELTARRILAELAKK